MLYVCFVISFPEISSRGGIATTNSTSIQNILLSNCMSQDDPANMDSILEASIEDTSQERRYNKRKREDELKFSGKSTKTKYNKKIQELY